VDIQILAAPYDSGNRGARMGAGPEALLDAGLEKTLRDRGHTVRTKIAEITRGSWRAEIQTSFELMRMLATEVRAARDAGRFPIVLAGNCSTAIGTLAGLGAESTGVAWFDAHADFNTPETTSSGFLDGTAVAIMTGRCWTQLALTVPDFNPIADDRVCLIGTRDVDPLERVLLDGSLVDVVDPMHLRTALGDSLDRIRESVEDIYLHLDLDVLDATVARANSYSLSGGLTLEDAEYCLSEIRGRFRTAGLTLSAYDPAGDPDGLAARAAIRLIASAASPGMRMVRE
jgi:arginase